MIEKTTDAVMSDGDFTKLRAIIHRSTGITIGETRKTMLVSRLRKRLREVEASSFATYIDLLSSNPSEMQELTNRVTTNKTYFYRTPRVWEYFCDEFLPEFLARGSRGQMRVWSAAASTGEEAHTIGMLLEERRQSKPGFDYSILGTDVSSRVLDLAQKGQYDSRSIAELRKERPETVSRYMAGNDQSGYKVSAEIKSRITFKLHNLLDTMRNTRPFDAVFLRNVLIYFTSEDQEKILRNVRDLMKPDGVLFIGESETLTNLNTDFDLVAPIIYKPGIRNGS